LIIITFVVQAFDPEWKIKRIVYIPKKPFLEIALYILDLLIVKVPQKDSH